MNEAVDTRVVEAKFDSKQFEQGVDRTVKKLDELKKSLNLKDSEKSVADIGEKVQEASEKASSALERLQNRYTEFTGMLKQKLLSGIADEIVGAIMKIKNSFLGLASSLSTGQIGYGMQRYTEMLTSVRTLVSAGETQEASYEVVERLGKYADQTSYSLDQLVSTMAKFKTSGASLSTAQRMVEGLSNAAASMGVNAQDATRAYLNMQQAYSKGAMMNNDWISFESLPMVGTKFNQAILDAAVEAGTLKKEKDGTYTVTSKALKSAGRSTSTKSTRTDTKGITAENMGTKLASRWFNKEVMEKVFGETYYFAEVENDEIQRYKAYEKELKQAVKEGKKTQEQMDKDLDDFFKAETSKRTQSKQDEFKKKQEELDKQLKANKITQKEYNETLAEYTKELEDFVASNTLTRFGWEAFRAGQEARSFTDVLNTLKDVISRGWAKSFELIFGKLDEASSFFTQLTDSEIANFIYSISEFRNEVLEGWNHTGGRDDLIGILETIDGLIGDIIHAFNFFPDIGATIMKEGFDEEAYNSFLDRGMSDAAEAYKESFTETVSFAEQLGDRLTTITRNVRDKIEKFRAWLNEDVDGETRIQKIVNLIKTAGEIIKNVFSGVSVAVRFAMKLIAKLDPIIQAVLNNIRKIIEPVRALFDTTSNTGRIGGFWGIMETGLNNLLIAITPLTKKDGPLVKLVDFLGGIVTFFAEMAMGTFQSNVQLFSDALGLLIEVFGGQSAQMEQGQGVLASIQNDIKSFGDTCKEAFKAVGDFFSAIIADIRTLLGLNNETGEAAENGGLFGNIKKFFNENEFLKQIEYFVTVTVPHKLQELPSVIGTFIESIFYDPKKQGKQDPKGNAVDARTPLKKWLDQAIADTKAFIKTIPTQLKKIPSIIGLFIKNLFYERETKKIWVDGKQMEVATGWKKRDFTKGLEEFLQSVVNTVVEFIRNIPSYINQGISATGTFIQNVISALFGRTDGSEPTNEDVENQLKAPFENINLESIWNTIKNIGKNILSHIIGIFTGTNDWASNKNTLATGIANGITWIRTKAGEALERIKNWFINLPTTIANFFLGSDDGSAVQTPKKEDNPVVAALHQFATDIGVKLSELPGVILSFWENAETALGKLWGTIVTTFTDALTGKGVSVKKIDTPSAMMAHVYSGGISAPTENDFEKNPIVQNLRTFFSRLIDYITDKIEHFPEDLVNGLNTTADIFQGVIETVTEWFKNENDGTAKGFEKADPEDSGFVQAISKFGSKIAEIITITIPGFIKEGFDWVAKNVDSWLSSLAGIFGGSNNSEVDGAIEDAGNISIWQKIEAFIHSIPGKLQEAFNWVKREIFGEEYLDSTYDFILDSSRQGYGKSAADAYKKETQNSPILNFFRGIVDEIGKTLENLGPTIVNALTSAVESAGKGLANVGNFFKNLAKDGGFSIVDLFDPEKQVDSEMAEDPTWQAVKGLGEAIWNVITVEIPKVVEGAFTYVGSEFTKLIHLIFGNEADRKEIDESINSDGESTFITPIIKFVKSIPDKIRDAFDWVKTNIFNETFSEQMYDMFLEGEGLGKAEAYKKATTSPILNFFRNMISDVGDLFVDLGPKILDGIKSALEWIKDKLGAAKGFFDDLTANEVPIDKIFDTEATDKQANPLWDSIRSVGKTIFDIMTNTLPGFISSAVTYIAGQVPTILSKLFGTETPEGKKSSESVAKAVTKSAEDAFKIEYFDQKVFDELYNSGRPQDAMRYLKKFQKDEKNLSDQVQKSAESGGLSMNSIFSFLLGSASAEESDTEEQLDNKKSIVNNLIDSGKSIFESIKGFVDSVKDNDLFKVIGIAAVVVLVLHELRIIVDNLQFIDNIGWTAKWVGIGALLTSIAAIIGTLTYLGATANEGTDEFKRFENTKKVLLDFLDAIKEIITELKWVFIGLGAFSIGNMVKELAGGDSSGGTTREMGHLEQFFHGILGPVETLFSSAASSLGKTAGVYAGGSMIGELIDQLSGNLNDALGELGNGVETLIGNIDSAVVKMNEMKKDNNHSITTAITVIPDIISLISELCKALNYETVDDELKPVSKKTVDSLAELNRIFASISGGLSLFKNAVEGYGTDAGLVVAAFKDLLGLRDDMLYFGAFAATKEFDDFKNALMSLGAITRLYADALSDIPEDSELEKVDISRMAKFLNKLFKDEEFKALISSFSSDTLKDVDMVGLDAAEKIITFAAALSSIAKACNDLTGKEADGINNLVDIVNGVKIKRSDNEKISTFASTMAILGNGIGAFALETSSLTKTSIDNAGDALRMLLEIATGLNSIPSSSWLVELSTGNQQLDRFGQRIENLGYSMNHFFTAIDGIDEQGVGHTYNEKNLRLVLSSLGSIQNFATHIATISAQGLENVENVVKDSDMFTNMAASIVTFLNVLSGNDPEHKLTKFEDSDFDYFDKINPVLDSFTMLIARVTNLDFSNLNLEDADESNNVLVEYMFKVIDGMRQFGDQLISYKTQMQAIKDYGTEAKSYMNILNSVLKSFSYITVRSFDAEKLSNFYDALSKGFFGTYEELKTYDYNVGTYVATGTYKHTGGLLDDFLGFFKAVESVQGEVEKNPDAYKIFSQVIDVVTEFSRCLSTMAYAAASSSVSDEYIINYTQYVYNMADALEAIMEKGSVFERFFEFGGKFNGSVLNNSLTMMSILNELAQFMNAVSDFETWGSNEWNPTDRIISKMTSIGWSRIIDAINQTIIYDNQDFFTPTIKPVLEITEEFKEKVAEMRQMLGIDPVTKKTPISAANIPTEEIIPTFNSQKAPIGFDQSDNTVLLGLLQTAFKNALAESITIPQPKDYTSNFTEIDKSIGILNTTMGNMNDAMASMRFVINGEEVAYVIGPTVDRYLGQRGYELSRGNMTNGEGP